MTSTSSSPNAPEATWNFAPSSKIHLRTSSWSESRSARRRWAPTTVSTYSGQRVTKPATARTRSGARAYMAFHIRLSALRARRAKKRVSRSRELRPRPRRAASSRDRSRPPDPDESVRARARVDFPDPGTPRNSTCRNDLFPDSSLRLQQHLGVRLGGVDHVDARNRLDRQDGIGFRAVVVDRQVVFAFPQGCEVGGEHQDQVGPREGGVVPGLPRLQRGAGPAQSQTRSEERRVGKGARCG